MAQQPGIRPVPRRARKSFSALTSDRDAAKSQGRRASAAGGAALTAGGAKAQRTSKTQQRLVVLPSAPQTKPLPKALSDDEDGEADDEDRVLGYETDAGQIRSMKSAGERWSKTQRENRGCKRMTAYSVANALKSKALAGFLRREHNVVPRVFDEAIYAVGALYINCTFADGSSIRFITSRCSLDMDPVSQSVHLHQNDPTQNISILLSMLLKLLDTRALTSHPPSKRLPLLSTRTASSRQAPTKPASQPRRRHKVYQLISRPMPKEKETHV
jgi:uncharacterized Rmd1/YagE family protein